MTPGWFECLVARVSPCVTLETRGVMCVEVSATSAESEMSMWFRVWGWVWCVMVSLRW